MTVVSGPYHPHPFPRATRLTMPLLLDPFRLHVKIFLQLWPMGRASHSDYHGYTLDTAEAAVEQGAADLVAFGRPSMANPDLVERFRHGWPLADLPDMALWWTPQGARGYVDFPSHAVEAG